MPYRHGGTRSCRTAFHGRYVANLNCHEERSSSNRRWRFTTPSNNLKSKKAIWFRQGGRPSFRLLSIPGCKLTELGRCGQNSPNRMIASGSNALAASVVLVCRKRDKGARAIGRREFLRELKPVMAEAILAHQKAGIPLPDRRQAAIGPGIGVFSKYSLVREANDSPMRVATALALINKELDALLSQGTEDSTRKLASRSNGIRCTGYGVRKGGSGDAIAQLLAFNLSEARINASGIFRARGGDAKLLTRDEMHAAVSRALRQALAAIARRAFTVWELAQHMVRTLRERRMEAWMPLAGFSPNGAIV